ncbi:MAG: S8 family serine peptidase, partial [Planctomycetia bacterium]|nr:S8 family serine peptidase [Planctomycetia bacterium]
MEQFEARMLLSISATSLEDISTYLSPNVVRAVERVSDLDAYTPEELALTRQWVVGVSDPTTASQMAAAAGADYLGASNVLRKASVWNFSADTSWETAVDLLEATEGIDYFYPLVPHTADLCLVPNDPLFPEQWHLENTGQDGGTPGLDAHVVPAWDSVLGTGVVIGVVDTGLQYNHPDLLAQYRADLSYDFIDHDPDPSPRTFDENHGTAVAGVSAAAGDNAVGVSGAAPGAEIAGLRLIGGYFTDFDCASALSYQNQEIDIYNNSWGPSASFFNWPRTEGPMSLAALEDGVTNGRDGLGNIYLFAAGNSRVEGSDANLFDLSNSRYAIAVAGIDSTGHYASYSNPGACLLISGYTDNIVTTDRTGEDGYNSTGTFDGDPLPDTNYTSTFNGTSAATPLVSGVIALILEANPSLTYRDVQYILVNSAEKNDAYDSDWTVNAAGYHVNHNYGFGAIDAEAAVQLAYGWENVSEEVTTGSDQIQINQTIPDGSTSGLTSSVTLDDTVTDIEWVEVTVDIAHSSPADLEVILTSPDGTKSRLANASSQGFYFSTTGYSNWTFTTCRDWGESSEGTWTLEVRDRFGGTVGSWNSWELNVYGQHIEDIPEPPEPGVEGIGPELVAIVPNAGSTIQNGAVLHISPRELMLQFNEGQEIDADTLGAIRIIRAGGDDVLGNANDEVVDFGWIGIGDRPNEVIIRFAETLPDDLYQITIVGAGDAPLTNIDGDVFHEGKDLNIRVTLDLGAQVIAVVP